MSDIGITDEPKDSAEPIPPKRARYILVLFQSGYEGDPFGDLSRFVFRDIQEKLDAVIDSPKSETEIDVWLESPGGDAHATYKLFLEIRERCAIFRAIVPDYAKSAATLLVLGADEIWMAPAADLGPLDAQIEHPDREGVTVSALDVAKSMGYLADFAVDYLREGGFKILRSTGLPRAEVLGHFSRFVARFLQPITSKLDPHLLYKSANELDVASRYAISMIRQVRAINDQDRPDGQDFDEEECLSPEELAGHLVANYPSHGFVISRKNGKDLGLPIKLAEEYDYWAQIKILHSAFIGGHLRTKETHSLIKVLHVDDLPVLQPSTTTEDEIAQDSIEEPEAGANNG